MLKRILSTIGRAWDRRQRVAAHANRLQLLLEETGRGLLGDRPLPPADRGHNRYDEFETAIRNLFPAEHAIQVRISAFKTLVTRIVHSNVEAYQQEYHALLCRLHALCVRLSRSVDDEEQSEDTMGRPRPTPELSPVNYLWQLNRDTAIMRYRMYWITVKCFLWTMVLVAINGLELFAITSLLVLERSGEGFLYAIGNWAIAIGFLAALIGFAEIGLLPPPNPPATRASILKRRFGQAALVTVAAIIGLLRFVNLTDGSPFSAIYIMGASLFGLPSLAYLSAIVVRVTVRAFRHNGIEYQRLYQTLIVSRAEANAVRARVREENQQEDERRKAEAERRRKEAERIEKSRRAESQLARDVRNTHGAIRDLRNRMLQTMQNHPLVSREIKNLSWEMACLEDQLKEAQRRQPSVTIDAVVNEPASHSTDGGRQARRITSAFVLFILCLGAVTLLSSTAGCGRDGSVASKSTRSVTYGLPVESSETDFSSLFGDAAPRSACMLYNDTTDSRKGTRIDEAAWSDLAERARVFIRSAGPGSVVELFETGDAPGRPVPLAHISIPLNASAQHRKQLAKHATEMIRGYAHKARTSRPAGSWIVEDLHALMVRGAGLATVYFLVASTDCQQYSSLIRTSQILDTKQDIVVLTDHVDFRAPGLKTPPLKVIIVYRPGNTGPVTISAADELRLKWFFEDLVHVWGSHCEIVEPISLDTPR